MSICGSVPNLSAPNLPNPRRCQRSVAVYSFCPLPHPPNPQAALEGWQSRTVKARAAIMFKFHQVSAPVARRARVTNGRWRYHCHLIPPHPLGALLPYTNYPTSSTHASPTSLKPPFLPIPPEQLLEDHADELAAIVTAESGKNRSESLASIAKGNETVEYACGLPSLVQCKKEEVSRGVHCEDQRDPVGIVASIVPFNFPIMVPMWTTPIALTMGNCVILKPSEKVPLTMHRVSRLMAQAGVPPGVFQMVQGTREVVETLCDHPKVSAVTFVGSSPVAKAVADRCRKHHKKVIALGGAKNHLVVLPDAEPKSAATDIVTSFAGAAGQRCMAASVLLLVGNEGSTADDSVLAEVVKKAAALKAGVGNGEVGAVIDAASQAKILAYINRSEKEDGATILVDGRSWAAVGGDAGGPGRITGGTWVGPTVILHKSAADAAVREEIFGPVLSVVRVGSWDEALAIENANPFGNAACIYTSVGAHANYFTPRFRAGMIGVNVGIPVPREPFAFGGLYGTLSKYGDMDITGEGCVEFFTNRRKITSRWPTAGIPALMHAPADAAATASRAADAAAAAAALPKDVANFNGNM